MEEGLPAGGGGLIVADRLFQTGDDDANQVLQHLDGMASARQASSEYEAIHNWVVRVQKLIRQLPDEFGKNFNLFTYNIGESHYTGTPAQKQVVSKRMIEALDAELERLSHEKY